MKKNKTDSDSIVKSLLMAASTAAVLVPFFTLVFIINNPTTAIKSIMGKAPTPWSPTPKMK